MNFDEFTKFKIDRISLTHLKKEDINDLFLLRSNDKIVKHIEKHKVIQ